jgi:hypothetical protein
MSVSIGKLWKDVWFQKQADQTKLLYLYLVTHPNLNTVGVLSLNLEVASLELGLPIEQISNNTKILRDHKLVYVKSYEDVIYFIIPAHFNTIPKSESSVSKVDKVMKSLPEELVTFLETVGITLKSKVREFTRPTQEEVVEYALSVGHLISGDTFIKYYDEQSARYGKKDIWVDGRGTQVRDWKSKLRKIWCKDENKIKSCPDAPKGYESFHVIEKGVLVVPDGWKNGKPHSKNFTSDIILKREYEKRKGNS